MYTRESRGGRVRRCVWPTTTTRTLRFSFATAPAMAARGNPRDRVLWSSRSTLLSSSHPLYIRIRICIYIEIYTLPLQLSSHRTFHPRDQCRRRHLKSHPAMQGTQWCAYVCVCVCAWDLYIHQWSNIEGAYAICIT